MLKKEPEKAMPDYQIKEILSYGDKVTDQSNGKVMSQVAAAPTASATGGNAFGELAIEVNKLEDIDEDQKVVKSKKKHHHEEKLSQAVAEAKPTPPAPA